MLSVKILPHFAFSNPKLTMKFVCLKFFLYRSSSLLMDNYGTFVSSQLKGNLQMYPLLKLLLENASLLRWDTLEINPDEGIPTKPLKLFYQVLNQVIFLMQFIVAGLLRNRNVTSLDFAELNDIEAPSSSLSEGFTITASPIGETNELKITVEVSGKKTQEIYDEVFSKMVDDAQPIPGFRRVKGGKTPNIPKHILLEILGPSKVYEQVLKKVINSAIADYVAKEGLAVGNDLQIEQSFEDLEAAFEPGVNFRFDAIVQCQDIN